MHNVLPQKVVSFYEQTPHDALQMLPELSQRLLLRLGILFTYSQLFLNSLSLCMNLNRNEESGSTQSLQFPQVTGHAAATPSIAHFAFELPFFTHEQCLEMIMPS